MSGRVVILGAGPAGLGDALGLARRGFDVEVREVRARPNNKGPRHTIWFARKTRA